MPTTGSLTIAEEIKLSCWHLDRYDRLRASTASRAAVVLSAGAILFAGNAFVLAQLLGASAMALPLRGLTIFTVAALTSAVLVVLSLICASDVLVTSRDSRTMFAKADSIPTGFVFNGTDTVERIRSFADFRAMLASQQEHEILEASRVELWICIQQHRHRYVRLRTAVRLLRYSAIAFVTVLAGAMAANLLLRL